MARALASTPHSPGAIRSAWYLLCDAADVSEMLLLSLLTGGAATAAACALGSLILWSARAARAALTR
jgi:hypothetical protein